MISSAVLYLAVVSLVSAAHENGTEYSNSTDISNNITAKVIKVVIIQEKFTVEWVVNYTAQEIQFRASIAVDDKGWFLFGFMPSINYNSATNITKKPTTLKDVVGDAVVSWPLSESTRKTLDCNTMNITGTLTTDNHQDYKVERLPSENNSSGNVVFQITRKLDTDDPQDVAMTDETLWMFGAYGNSDKYYATLDEFSKDIEDTLNFTKVKLMEKTTEIKGQDEGASHWVMLVEVKKHWVTVVMTAAAVSSVAIVSLVYCCSRKGGIKKRKMVAKSFYREDIDEDDEARVAFLHSRT